MDLLLVNLVVMGFIDRDLSPLMDYVETVSAATDVPIPDNYPVVGRDAFRTATGVHAAAVVKALEEGRSRPDGRRLFGDPGQPRRPRSRRSKSARCQASRTSCSGWSSHGIPCSEPIVDRVFAKAKSSTTVLTEAEILAEVYR